MSAGLRARGLARRFGGVHAVRDVSLDVAPGEVVGLIGPNGAGKSTVVNLLHGSLRADGGRVWLDDEDVTTLPPHERSRRGLVRTFQSSVTFPSLTALDAVAAGLTVSARDSLALWLRAPRRAAVERAGVRTRARSVLDDVGLGRVPLDVPVATLPPAVNRMLGLAIALAVRPRVLLLDEPCAGLGAAERDLLTATARRLAGDGVGVLVIDHDVRVIMRACDRVVVLNEGAVIATGRRPTSAATSASARRTSGTTMLALDGVVAGYEGVPVVGPLDMRVPARTTVAIVGANGAGKTTVLHAIAGLVPVMSGTISLEGRALQSLRASARARSGVGYALEGHRVFPEMTVQENLLAGLPRAVLRDPRALDECFELFPALATRRSQLAGSLSGGERQMLALARVLARRPDIVLLDEPSLGLAPMLVAAVFDSIAALARSGRTILVAEQNAERALSVADHAYVLELGRVVAEGPPDELRAGDALTTAYLGGERA